MNIKNLVAQLKSAGAQVIKQQGKWSVRLPKTLSPQLKQQVQENKVALKVYLQSLDQLGSEDNRIRASKTDLPAPLSSAQRRLWFLDRVQEKGSAEYHIFVVLALQGRLDLAVATQAVEAIIARHEILSTVYTEQDNEPVQRAVQQAPFVIATTSLDDITDLTEDKLHELFRQEVERPFDLQTGPLFRMSYFYSASDDNGYLLVNMHHILADGWSLELFNQEFISNYEAMLGGKIPVHPELPIQYKDYAMWQNEQLQDGQLAQQLNYWSQQLAELPLLHNLAQTKLRPKVKQHLGKKLVSQFSSATMARVTDIAQHYGMSPFVFVHAILALLFSRHSNSDDIVVGLPVANRNQPELASLIGCFVNTLVLRVNTAQSCFSDYMAHVKQVHREALKNQEVPLELIIEQLGIPRSLSATPAFQILLTANSEVTATSNSAPSKGFAFQEVRLDASSVKTDLDIAVHTTADALTISWNFDVALFCDTQIARMQRHFETLLESVLTLWQKNVLDTRAPETLPMFNLAEQQALVLRGTTFDEQATGLLHARFERQVETHPDRTAVYWQDTCYSYGLLGRKVEQLSQLIGQTQAGQSGQLIGVCMVRSTDMVIAMLAILRAGAGYVPLDPDYPQDRINYMLGDTQVPVVLTDPSSESVVADHHGWQICLDNFVDRDLQQASSIKEPQQAPNWRVDNEQALAYVIYTSGSTGRPKGVMVTHSNAVAMLSWAAQEFSGSVTRRMLAATSINFDLSVFEIFLPLSLGHSLVLVDNILTVTKSDDVTLINTVPSAMQTLLDTDCLPETVEVVNLAGEPLQKQLVNRIFAQRSQIRVYNLYGPSEDTTYSTYARFDAPLSNTPHIGQPIAGTQAYVLDRNLQLAPEQVSGELYLGGAGVTVGYLNKASLTDAVFINNPYYDPADQHSSPYLYKTGDLVRLRSDANLDYLGRTDSQVKIHGYRIELGEIEHHLNQISEVDSSVALVTEQANGHSQILAFVKCSAHAPAEPDGLLRQLSKALPAYMVPHSIHLVVEWPYTSNGKIDKQALSVTSTPAQLYQKPVTQTQLRLAAIWATLLCCEVEKIGCSDGFFALGGNSLLSAKLAAHIADEFQLTIKISEIFEHQQLAQLAACIDDKEHDTHTDAIVAVPRSTEGHTLSMAQHRLWMLDQSLGGSHQYNIPMAYTVKGTLDLTLAAQALNDVIRRHEVLRTRYVEKAGQVVQIPCEQVLKLTVFDLSEDSSTDQQARCDTILSQQAKNTFDLENEGVIRAGYIRLQQASGAQQGVLYCVIHHIAFDGESQHIFYREFVSRYAQLQSGSVPALDMLPLQYIDYALWEHSQPRTQQLAGQTQYWLEQLADLPQLHSVPGDFPRPSEMSLQGATYTQPLSIALGEQLHALAAAQECTLFMVFHAAFSILLARYSNESDIVLGMPVSGRHHPQCRELIGLFVNTLILRTDVDPCSQFSAYLQDVKRINLAAHDNQDVQLQTLLELLAPTRSSAHAPLFQMVISMNSDHSEQVSIPDLSIVANEIENKTAKFDLILHISEGRDGINLAFEYSKDLFAEATIVRMMGHFTKLLDEIVIAPDTPIGHLPIVSEEEKHELIHKLNPTSEAHTDSICMHELFYRQTWLTPDATALIAAQGQLSYRQLYHQARQIAMQLSQYELSSECLVAVRIPKGPMQAIATMAILMAGGAYLPLEVSWPQARCEKILNKAGCSLLLLSDAKHGIEQAGVVNITLPQIDFARDDYADEALPTEIPETLQSATDLAYVIFTSGSTGEPKGVEIEHHAAVNTLLEINRVYQVDEKDAILAVSALSFDLSVYDIFGLLAAGGAVVFPDADKATDPEHWLAVVERYNITLWDTVPSSAGLLAEQLELQERRCTAPLRHVMMSGDWIPPSLPRRLWDRFSACQVHSMGGATEGSIWSIHYPVTTDPCNQKSIPYGKPLYGQSFYILTQSGQFVPKGNIGELHIGGRGVARGYCGAPELTAERFIWHPELQQTLYRTGDLGRYMADGNIEFLGRVDHQVKIRGFRVELAEIEYQVKQHEAVKDALVVVSELQGAAQLIAYVIPETLPAETFATQLVPQLKHYLHINLTDYMVPAVFVPVAQWPVTANGKVDKKALPAPSETLVGAAYQAPQTEIESVLQKLWAELLQLDCEQVSTTANFFELGGDSILSIQLVSRAAKAGLHFSARALFEAQTIRQLAPQVQSQAERLAEQGPVSGLQPLLPIQQQLFADSTDVHHFNQAVLLTPALPLSQSHLISLVAALYGRHDALSVRYQPNDAGQWQGEYTPQRDELALARDSVSSLDLSGLSEAQYQAQMDQLQASFVLSQGRLLQAVQVRLPAQLAQGENDERLLLMIHHLAVDGVSWRILLEDLALGLQQLQRSASLTLAAKTSSYQQWGTFLADHAHTEAVQQQRDYWLEVLSTSEPTLAERYGATQEMAGTAPGQQQQLNFSLSAAQTEQLLGPCQRSYRSTTLELLLAAILSGFERFDGTRSVCLDLEGHGRESDTTQLDLSQTVGWFTAIYPLRLSCEGNTPGALLNGVKRQYRAIPNKGMDFALLQHSDGVLAALPAREIVFNYLGQFDQINHDELPFSVAEEYSGQTISTARTPWHGVTLTTLVSQGQLHFSLSYAEAGYDGAAMAELLFHIEQGLADLIAHCMGTQQGEYTQVDFPLATAEEASIRQWQAQYGEIQDLYPATGMQQGLLFHSMLAAGSYVTQMTLDFSGVDKSRLAEAWRQVVARHDILRSVFVGLDSAAAHQLVLPDMPLAWREYDLSEWSAEAQADEIERLREEIKVGGFDAGSGPLMSLVLIELGGGQQRLLWSHHHAILDGWCLPIIFAELTAFYQGEGARLAAPQPYRHYAAYLAQQDGEVAQAYWRDVLAEVEHKTPLPLAHQRAEQRAQEPAMQARTVTFSEEQTGALSAFAKRSQTTVNILVQGAWALLLSKYGGGSQVVFGSTTSGRPATLTGVDEMVGLFINTLPVVAKVEGETPVVSWLQQLHRTQQASEEYSHVPLHTLQQLAGMNAGLFDTLVIFENYPVDAIQTQTGAALPVEAVESVDITTYPMTLTARLDKTLVLKFEYQNTVLSEPGAAQLLAHLQQLLHLLSSPGDNTLRDIKRGMLSNQARKEIFTRSVGEQIHFPGARCFHHRFEQQVRRNGDAIAACHGPHTVHYAALNRRANQLAYWLIEQGVTQGQLVGIFAHRSIDVLCAMLAIMKAGGAFVCLDPVNPDERLTYMIEDAGMTHLIVDPACRMRIDTTAQLSLFDITQSATVLSDMPVDNPQVAVQGSDVAYMIYTSGSTGNPKGALVHHSGALNHIEAEFAKFGLTDEENALKKADFLQCAASSCDVSVWQFLAPLMCGGKTVILDEITDVHTMVSLIRQYQIDLVEVAPVVLQLLVSYLDSLTESQRQLPGLKYIMTTGEPTPVPLVNKWLNMYPLVPVMNCYGPTEASDDITYEITRVPLPAGTTRVSIGKPLPNLAILILDEELDLMPEGVAGELCVAGIGVGPGYWNNVAKTQASFVPNPYQHEPLMPMYSERLYRTGDLGYYDEHGNIELLGRKDEQIKIRGLRVELGEIEAALEAIEQVQQAVVVVKNNELGEAALCAYWTGEPGVTLTRKEFRLRLGQALPEHMLPVSYNQLEKMPTNAADKIDKFALPEPNFTSQQTYVEAQTETEAVVAELVAALLQLEVAAVSLADSFFELGGHSILSVRLVSEIQHRFGVSVPLGFIFTLSDLRELAAEIDVLRPQQQDSAQFAQLTAESQTDTDELII